MAKPKSMAGRKMVSLPPHLWERVEDFRFEGRYKTESEAIRHLVEAGLRLDGVYAHVSDLERKLFQWAERAGASEKEMADLKAWAAMGRRLTEPLGPEFESAGLRLDISKEDAAESLQIVQEIAAKRRKRE